jgi:hypothetical protein
MNQKTFSLCPEGHLTVYEDQDGIPFPSMSERHPADRFCSHCGSTYCWETRSESEFKKVEILEAPVMQVCDLGCEHLLAPARYKVPVVGK